MSGLVTLDRGQRANPLPSLSFSRLNRYLTCPEQYRLYYIEGWRRKVEPASLVFGRVLHEALAAFFADGEDPIAAFRRLWGNLGTVPLAYRARESWQSLEATGIAVLERFTEETLPCLGTILDSEKRFELTLPDLDVPFKGIVDLVVSRDIGKVVLDFKSSSRRYSGDEAVLSDQLTAYHLAVPDASHVAFCVLLKTKEPRIQWCERETASTDVVEFLHKASLVARAIGRTEFYKRPGPWCRWCDFLPICAGEDEAAAEALKRAEPAISAIQHTWAARGGIATGYR